MTIKVRFVSLLPDPLAREPDEWTHEIRDTLRLYPAWVSWLAAMAACISGVTVIVDLNWFSLLYAFSAFALAKHLVRQTRIRRK